MFPSILIIHGGITIVMRIKSSAANISAESVKAFYEQRASSYTGENLQNITTLQDKNPSLSEERNNAEIAKLLPKLRIAEDSCVLDLACGAGRWLSVLPEFSKYRGIDFSSGMIDIARSVNTRPNAEFFTGSVLDVDNILAAEKGSFNRAMIIGSLMYINDDDVISLFRVLPDMMTKEGALLCVKASIGIDDRLTLKDFFSDELQSDYNAIYRTRDEYMKLFADALIPAGFSVTDEGFMYDDGRLNNRKETAQYYFILER